MSKVKQGKFVQVHYTGTLKDGSVFDSSDGRTPLEFQVGGGQVISGFDKAVMDMKVNEEKTFTLTSEQAYGPPRDDLQREFPVTMLGEEQVQEGQDLWFNSPRGPVSGKVLAVEAETFTVDFNHPLAGKDLSFHIKLVGISDQPTQPAAASCSCSHGTEGSCGSDCG